MANRETNECNSIKRRNCFIIDDGYVQVYVAANNDKKCFGIWFGPNNTRNLAEPASVISDIEACLRALQVANSAKLTKMCINTTRDYIIMAITDWMPRLWSKNGWKTRQNQPVEYKDIYMKLHEEIERMGYDNFKMNLITEEDPDAYELLRQGANSSRE